MFKTLLVLLVASAASASFMQPNAVKSLVHKYGMERIAFLQQLRMPSTAKDKCDEKYMALLAETAENSKVESTECIVAADNKRQEQLVAIEEESAALEKNVNFVIESLDECKALSNFLEYLQCLTSRFADIEHATKEVGRISEDLQEKLEKVFEEIRAEETCCINEAIDTAKAKTDQLFDDYRNCLINGGDEDPSEVPNPNEENPNKYPESDL